MNNDMAEIGPIAGGLIGTGVLVIGAALWYGGWQLYESSVNRENDIMQHSHAMQQGDIAQDRDLVIAWHNTNDTGQRKYISDQFCATLQNVTDVPKDLANAKTDICP